MKILFATRSEFNKISQVGRFVEVPRILVNLGHKVSLIAASRSWSKNRSITIPANYENVKSLSVGNIPFLLSLIYSIKLAYFFSITILFKLRPVDIVIVDYFSVLSTLPFAILSRLRIINTRFVLDIRSCPVENKGVKGTLLDLEYKIALFFSRLLFDGISVISNGLKDELVNQFHFEPDLICIWTSGASLKLFDPANISRPDDAKHLEDKFIIVHHGVLSQTRGLQQTIEAMDILKIEYPEIVLLLLGNGEGENEMKQIVIERKLEKNVFFHDAVNYNRVPDYISIADAGIIPLPDIRWWQVSSPQKLMEYLAMGKPVIVSDIDAHRNVIKNSNCAVFLSSVNPLDISKAILDLYSKRDTLKEMGKVGRKIIEDKYTWDSQVGHFERYLQKLFS